MCQGRRKPMSYLEEIDVPSAKERFMNNEALYKRFLLKFPANPVMADLEQHLKDGNVDEAFRDAHTMKGMVGNLSLNKLIGIAAKVTETLRAGKKPGEEEMDELRTAYNAAVEAVNEIQETNAKLF